ncbi:acyl carrier protein phosphodiesterase [Edwardsiella hoshinae]|uniref:Acyl carrier protein phosphodiesterase n=2 Tax=Edwardsiella hoshinae TaxID=93378 RepID=A0A376DJT9_9GAMM|nr:acyl carrier protein phosphodiesterase [Edwardsiella hoshinae]
MQNQRALAPYTPLPYTRRMNFLAHLHLAALADSSLLGNLLADFVRGDPQPYYDDVVCAGIRMHRRVDRITDGLPQVRAARAWFSAECRRIAPITLDIVWDHFLARDWTRLEPNQPLAHFVAHAARTIQPQLDATPASFQHLNHHLWQERWLQRYAELPFLARVLNGMAQRRPRLAALSGSFRDIERHYAQFERQFWDFYPQMMQQARERTL